MSSVAGVPARRWSGLRRTAATSWQLTVVPARSARNSAVQWTTGTPQRPGRGQQPGGVGHHAGPLGRLGQLGEGAEVADHAPLDLHGQHGAVGRCGQLAQIDRHRVVPFDPSAAAQCPEAVRSPPLSVSSGTSATMVGRPPVVRLAARRPHDGLHHVELAGHLVAGDGLAAVDLDVLEGRVPVGPGLDDGRHPLAPALVGGPHHDGVEDLGMGAHGRLDLLGEDLLAARVDGHRSRGRAG